MRFEKIVLIFVFAFVLSCPFSLQAQVPPSFEIPPAITEVDARQFLDEYMAQYMKMDINAFMVFFSKEAIENRLLTYADIREVYRRTFENSDSLLYHLEIFSVRVNKEGVHVTGRYEVTQGLRGSPLKKVFKGNIQWGLISENGALKVKDINYGRDYRGDQPSHPYP